MSDSCQIKKVKVPFSERIRTWDFWKPIVFISLGGIAGFAYYYFIGCASGSCAITGNPYASIAFGGYLGYFIVNRPCAC